MSEAAPPARRRLALTLVAGAVALVVLAAAVGAVAAWHYRLDRNEARAIQSLKTLMTAQAIFREGEKDENGTLDYGTLEQLGAAGLIDELLASGTKDGYVFRAAPSVHTPEFLWFATAEPESPGIGGRRYFCTNQAGLIVFTTSVPFAMNTGDCNVPAR